MADGLDKLYQLAVGSVSFDFSCVLIGCRELIQKHEVCVRVLGNLNLLPLDVQEVIAECVHFSKDNKR